MKHCVALFKLYTFFFPLFARFRGYFCFGLSFAPRAGSPVTPTSEGIAAKRRKKRKKENLSVKPALYGGSGRSFFRFCCYAAPGGVVTITTFAPGANFCPSFLFFFFS